MGPIYGTSAYLMPSQVVPLKDKLEKPKDNGDKSWSQLCMDAMENIGRNEFNNNLKLIENYEMIKGRFIFDHYFQTDGIRGMIEQLTAEFELPNYLRHYDIISQVVNTLSGEYTARPDVFKVVQLGDTATNEYLRTKLEMTQQYVLSKINAEIANKLAEQGIDVNKSDFANDQEAQQYQEQVQQMQQKLTPPEIQKFMDTDFLTQAEIWGQHQMAYDRELFNLPEKEKVEFEDMLVADRSFRHFYLTPTGYNQETWNPVNTFYKKSDDIRYIEDGDLVGRIFNLSINTIIDRYGYLMDSDDYDMLRGRNKKDKTKWEDNKYDWVFDNYMVPFKDYPQYDLMKKSFNINGGPLPVIDDNMFNQMNSNNSMFQQRDGFFFVTEGYWKSQKLIYKITYTDLETGEPVIQIVDENFIIPSWFKESVSPGFNDQHEPNTYVKTYVNEVWKGIKINTGSSSSAGFEMNKDLYLDIRPNDFQFKGDLNMYGCKLPVCGEVFSVRNSRSMSLVDMMKPYQIGYNVAINQLYQLAEKEIGMFIVMDVGMFPDAKDWGGEDAWSKWMLMAKSLGMLPADTSPANIKGALGATGGYLPKVIDLNLAGQMVSRMNIAKFFEEQALKQVGFNAYRTGNFNESTTATGIEQGQAKSYSQTQSYFTNFSNYLRRCKQMGLGMAQYVQSQKPDVTFTYVKSDMSRGFVKVLGTELLLCDLGVLVTNSQENIRQLEMMRQFALENNTSGLTPPDIADVIMMNSTHEIRRQLQVSYDKLMGQQQQQQQLEQQKLQQQQQQFEMDKQIQAKEFEEKLQNNLDVAYINNGAKVLTHNEDLPTNEANGNKAGDMALKAQQQSADSTFKQQQLAQNKEKLILDNTYNQQKLALEQSKIAASLQIQNQETETARILMQQKHVENKAKINKPTSKK